MFSVVLPATGEHAWDITEGWVQALREMNLLKRVFRPRSEWGDLQVAQDDGLLEYLLTGPEDYLLLLGFDWHSQPLHQGPVYELLCERKSRNISVVWEDYNISNDIMPGLRDLMLAAWDKAAQAVALSLTNHESNKFALEHVNAHCRLEYLGFGVDVSKYKHRQVFARRKTNTLYFSGKLNAWQDVPGGGPYAQRREIATFLGQHLDNLVLQTGQLSEDSYRDALCQSRVCLNLPSFTYSPTLRCYEALAAGSLLLTWQLDPSASRDELLRFPNVFFYDPNDPHDALDQYRLMASISSQREENMIQAGYRLAHQTISHQARIRQLLQILGSDDSALTQPAAETTKLLVVDCVFFQVAVNGIAYVWDSVIRTYIKEFGGDSIVLIRRSANLPDHYACRIIDADPIDWDKPPQDVAHEIDLMLAQHQIHDFCFASTYYTTSKLHRTITVIHDMIPEILSGDESVWQHKQFSMERSEAIVCVSHSTHWDLRGYSWQLASKAIVCPNGLPYAHYQSEFADHPPLTDQQIDLIRSDYSVLFVGGRLGWKGYKNGATLIKAFRIFWEQVRSSADVKLIFVSHSPEPESQIQDLLEGLPVVFMSATDSELFCIRQNCQCLVYSSLIEGFGLPIIEGLYCGSAVIASSITPHREASLGYDVQYFPPTDERLLADLLLQSFTQSRTESSPASHRERQDEIELVSSERWHHYASTLRSFTSTDWRGFPSQICKHDAVSREISAAAYQFKKRSILASLDAVWNQPSG